MRTSRAFSILFGLLGILLASAVIAACILERDAAPRMLSESAGITECADGMLSKICAGDYAGASAYLYGHPTLDGGQVHDSEVSALIWEAFTGSLRYELVGRPYATTSGAAQDVTFRSLQIPGITAQLKQRAGDLVEQKVEAAEDMSEIYLDDLSYREDFVKTVLREAVEAAIAGNGEAVEQKLTLNLVCESGQWLVVPDQALLNAISGGILGS